MQKAGCALELYITANSNTEREGWSTHFSNLLEAVTRIDAAGLWQGTSEPSIILQHVHFGGPVDFGGKVQTILDELRTYQLAANQYAVLVGVCTGGTWTYYLLEGENDYSECAWNVLHDIAEREEDDILERTADILDLQARVSVGLTSQ